MIDQSLHYHLLRLDALRAGLAEYGMPSAECLKHVESCGGQGRRSLEIGFSLLSLKMAQSGALHRAVLPMPADLQPLALLCAEHQVSLERFDPVFGAIPDCLTPLESESFDHVVLSAPLAFPLFFAAAFAAFRLLKTGGRLTVRGAGTWTVEQLKNFLRNDPAWRGFQIAAPDAISIAKAGPAGADWRAQPYVSANSSIFTTAAIADASTKDLYSRVANFSTTAAELAQEKEARRTLPVVGLVGYYGFGNYGDELFRLGFEAGLPDIRLKMLHDIPRRPYYLESKRNKVAGVSAIVIGGGDILIPGYWSDFYFEDEFLEKPIYIHGIGVPRWTGGEPPVLKRLRAFLQHANVRHINVRDQESADWIETHMRPRVPVEVSADIVCGMALPDATAAPGARQPVLGLVTRKHGSADSEYAPLRRLVEQARSAGYRVRQIIAGNGLVGVEDYEDALARNLPVDEIYRAATIEEVTAAVVQSDVVASMKFHGCVVGVMSGRPTFGLLLTDKFKNFYRALEIQDMLVQFTSENTGRLLEQPLRKVESGRLSGLRQSARGSMAALRHRLSTDLAGKP
jgi:polysaccharide pyruvyl transferase WcaK-like protein